MARPPFLDRAATKPVGEQRPAGLVAKAPTPPAAETGSERAPARPGEPKEDRHAR